MQDFANEHRALLVRTARAFCKANGEKIAPDDVARELELVIAQLTAKRGVTREQTDAPDAFARALVKHAAGRAKRRRTLIEQLAAGDDLGALTADLAALDADLPELPPAPSQAARETRRALDRVKEALPPRDALVFALLLEDDGALDEVATAIGRPLEEVAAARERVLHAAASEGSSDEQALRDRARHAAGHAPAGEHVPEPLLALVRAGDHAEDIVDAIAHVARCPDCRARLVEGDVDGRNVVVMAIEAPRASSMHIARAAEASSARLVERGAGRWTAVVDARKADKLRGELVNAEAAPTSRVSRLAMASPVVQGRTSMSSVYDFPGESGTDAAEVAAWAQIPRSPHANVAGAGAGLMGWALFATAAVLGAIAIAYLLAIR